MDVLNLPENKMFNNYRNSKLNILAMLIKTILSTIKVDLMGSLLGNKILSSVLMNFKVIKLISLKMLHNKPFKSNLQSVWFSKV